VAANVGFGRATGEWILKLNTDSIVTPQVFELLAVDTLLRPDTVYRATYIDAPVDVDQALEMPSDRFLETLVMSPEYEEAVDAGASDRSMRFGESRDFCKLRVPLNGSTAQRSPSDLYWLGSGDFILFHRAALEASSGYPNVLQHNLIDDTLHCRLLYKGINQVGRQLHATTEPVRARSSFTLRALTFICITEGTRITFQVSSTGLKATVADEDMCSDPFKPLLGEINMDPHWLFTGHAFTESTFLLRTPPKRRRGDDLSSEVGSLLKEKDEDKARLILSRVKKEISSAEDITAWSDPVDSKHNTLLHLAVSARNPMLIRLLCNDFHFNINSQRKGDKCTPLHLSIWNQTADITSILSDELAADWDLKNSRNESPRDLKALRDKMLRLVWISMVTAPPERTGQIPPVLEVYMRITNSEATEVVSENRYVVECPAKKLDASCGDALLARLKQKNAYSPGGLYFECARSTMSYDACAEAMLEVLRKECPRRYCLLAGYRAHAYRGLLQTHLPRVADWLHQNAVMDVSSLH
ncbi:hypothetical protein FOZ62_032034, partial [Perkinsus olseni]